MNIQLWKIKKALTNIPNKLNREGKEGVLMEVIEMLPEEELDYLIDKYVMSCEVEEDE